MMKQKALRQAIELSKIESKKRQQFAEHKREQAMSIAEISHAHKYYTNLRFNDIRTANPNNIETKFAYDAYLLTLEKFGFSESDFDDTLICEKCNDTGIENGKICDCIKKTYSALLYQMSGLDSAPQFELKDFDCAKISDEVQRKSLQEYFNFGKIYAEKFPNKTKSIVFYGKTGTGKTCYATAIAREILKNGHSVLFMTAFELNQAFLNYHISPLAGRKGMLDNILDADLLVIDDLGTEQILKNVTVEYLSMILQERMINQRTTFITTNLNENGLQDRYGERIYSRLKNKQNARTFSFTGNDLRLKN